MLIYFPTVGWVLTLMCHQNPFSTNKKWIRNRASVGIFMWTIFMLFFFFLTSFKSTIHILTELELNPVASIFHECVHCSAWSTWYKSVHLTTLCILSKIRWCIRTFFITQSINSITEATLIYSKNINLMLTILIRVYYQKTLIILGWWLCLCVWSP